MNLQYLHLGFTQSINYHTELDSRGISIFDEDVDYDRIKILLEQVFFLKPMTSCPCTEISVTLYYGKGEHPVVWESFAPNAVALSAEMWTGSRAWKGTHDTVTGGVTIEGGARWKEFYKWVDWFVSDY